jgi:ATP-dependent DNA helicase RecQ
MRTLLKQYFGFDGFRPLQEDIITHVLSGRDTCVIMPTGSGKSLCYQLPALAFDGITLVISPLIALMKDQVDALRANGVQATCINSTLSPDAIRAANWYENRIYDR